MGTDYNEIICTAIDTIVSSRIEQLQYDITKVCLIDDDSMAAQGKYIVADGAAKYEAFTNDTSLRKGNSVQVLIPNGDYNMQKTIISRIAANDTTPYNYISPMDVMLKITDNIFLGAPVVGLLANEDSPKGEESVSKSIQIHRVSNLQDLGGYTRLGLEADIRTWLPSDTVSGTYGIQLKIIDQNDVLYELQPFTNNEMYGNPYQFNNNFTQEMVYDISHIDSIKTIEAFLFEDGKFKNDQDEYIPWQEEFDGEVLKSSNNIFVDDLKLYFGYGKNELSNNFIQIYSPEGTLFGGGISNESSERNIQVRWFQRNKDNDFDLMPESAIQKDAYEIKWFNYTGNMVYKDGDVYYPEAGYGWHLVQDYNVSKPFTHSFTITGNEKSLSYKVICYEYLDYATSENGNKSSNHFTSNILVFSNRIEVADQATITANNALTVKCLDGSEGNYFLYDSLGQIIRNELGKKTVRYLQASFSDNFLSGYKKITGVKWTLPSKNTMLDFDWIEENNGQFRIDGIDMRGELVGDAFILNLKNVKDENLKIDLVNDKKTFLSYLKLPYNIKNQQSYNLTDNNINCEIRLDGVPFFSSKQFVFGRIAQDSYGLNLSLNFEDNATALIAQPGQEIKVKANLYRWGNEEPFYLDDSSKDYPKDSIIWEWYREADESQIKLQEEVKRGKHQTFSIGYVGNSFNENHYSILQATFKREYGENIPPYQIVTYLPIPIRASADYISLDGATEVIYETNGKPIYTPTPYYLTASTNESFSYQIVYKFEGESEFLPKLEYGMDGASPALKVTDLNIKMPEDRIAIVVRNQNGRIVWVQPILIQQNQISNSTEQTWNSDILIGGDTHITNALLGRGFVDEENKISGIFIGDKKIDDKNEENSLNTGIYGAKKDEVTYYLDEFGDFYFKSEKITIDPKAEEKLLSLNQSYFDTTGKFFGTATNAANADFASAATKLQATIDGTLHEYDANTIIDLYEKINQLQDIKIKNLETDIGNLTKRIEALEKA